MDKNKYRFQHDQHKGNSYVNQVISLENIQFNRFTNLHLDNFKFSTKKGTARDNNNNFNALSNRDLDRFKKNNQDSISENPLSQTISNLKYKSSHHQDQFDQAKESQDNNKVLKYKIEALESRIKYLREKNYDLKNKVNHQANADTFEFEDDNIEHDKSQYYNQPREIDYLKSLYDHILIQYKQLDKQMNYLVKENQHNKKQISHMKKIINSQNLEIRSLKKKMFKQENLIEQNQEDYLRLLETLNRRNQEEQNLLQKIKILQQKQNESNNFKSSDDRDINSKSNRQISKRLLHQNQQQRKILKVKIEKLKNKKLDSLHDSIENSQEEDQDIPFLQVLNMKQKNLQILKGRHSLGNQVTKKIIERKTCQPLYKKKDSLESSYSSKDYSQLKFYQQWNNKVNQLYQHLYQVKYNNALNIVRQIFKNKKSLQKSHNV